MVRCKSLQIEKGSHRLVGFSANLVSVRACYFSLARDRARFIYRGKTLINSFTVAQYTPLSVMLLALMLVCGVAYVETQHFTEAFCDCVVWLVEGFQKTAESFFLLDYTLFKLRESSLPSVVDSGATVCHWRFIVAEDEFLFTGT